MENWSVLQSPSAPPLVVLTDVAVAVDVPNTGSEISKLSKSNLKLCLGGFEIFALFFLAIIYVISIYLTRQILLEEGQIE